MCLIHCYCEITVKCKKKSAALNLQFQWYILAISCVIGNLANSNNTTKSEYFTLRMLSVEHHMFTICSLYLCLSVILVLDRKRTLILPVKSQTPAAERASC